MASGMKHVETNTYDVKRLLHVKGKRNIRATEVSPAHRLSWAQSLSTWLLNDFSIFSAGGNELGQF